MQITNSDTSLKKKKKKNKILSSPSFKATTVSLLSQTFNQGSEYGTVLAGTADIFCTVTLTGTNLNTKTQSLAKQKELQPSLLRETFVSGPILDAMAASYMRKQR